MRDDIDPEAPVTDAGGRVSEDEADIDAALKRIEKPKQTT